MVRQKINDSIPGESDPGMLEIFSNMIQDRMKQEGLENTITNIDMVARIIGREIEEEGIARVEFHRNGVIRFIPIHPN